MFSGVADDDFIHSHIMVLENKTSSDIGGDSQYDISKQSKLSQLSNSNQKVKIGNHQVNSSSVRN